MFLDCSKVWSSDMNLQHYQIAEQFLMNRARQKRKSQLLRKLTPKAKEREQPSLSQREQDATRLLWNQISGKAV